MPAQLSFEWPARVALGEDDFFISEANETAYLMLCSPDLWPQGKLALIGPPRSGKTHLARLFAQQTDAQIMDAPMLERADFEPPDCTHMVIENMDQLRGEAEERVFHLHNHLAATGGKLLLTAQSAPNRWTIALPDLASRMQATNIATISDPDETLLGAVMMKQFQDRQLGPTPSLIQYLSRHIEQSFAAAGHAVITLDRMALQQGREINRALAMEYLDKTHQNGA